MPAIRRKPTQAKGSRSPEAIAMRRAMRESDPKRLGGDLELPEEDTGDRQHFVFYQDDGGMRATDESEEPLDTIYYLGVIDILTPYNTLKRLENAWKGLRADRVSAFPRSAVCACGSLGMGCSIKSARSRRPNTAIGSSRS